jgi:hypothetical protein
LERLLGSRVDLSSFYQLADEDTCLHELASRFRGLKPPRFPAVWEGFVNGIACQQFSLTVGILLLNCLAALCGLASGKDDAGVERHWYHYFLHNQRGELLTHLLLIRGGRLIVFVRVPW